MEILQTVVLVVNIISALAVILLVLMQHGKGADMGAAFGSGSAGSLFGSSGSANFLSRTTAICAIIFFATCIALAAMLTPKQTNSDLGVMGSVQTGSAQPAPAAPQNSPTDTQKSSRIPD